LSMAPPEAGASGLAPPEAGASGLAPPEAGAETVLIGGKTARLPAAGMLFGAAPVGEPLPLP